MLKKLLSSLGLIVALTLFAHFSSTTVQAKGGGGGGGDTTCSADTWDCGDWSECNQGKQSRSCNLTFDCAEASDPSPITSQSCQSTCDVSEWSCSDWSECDGRQTRKCTLPSYCENSPTPKPREQQTCEAPKQEVEADKEVIKPVETKEVVTPNCTEKDFECSDWGICEEDGKQRRSCTLPTTCPNKNLVLPAQEQVCAGLKCGQLETVKERIECRLKLTKEETKKEQKILYAPEYCRIEEGAQEKAECINLYWALEKCWAMPAGEKRQACGREETNMTQFEKNKADCATKTGDERTACHEELKSTVENWMLFEMYELEFLAESLMEEDRVSFEDVVEFDVYIEAQKAKIEDDDSITAWKKLVKETQEAWKLFVNQKVK